MLLAGRRLLAVGEKDDLARAVAAAAAPRGAEVVACRGGREALARIDAGGVDAVLVDLPLPDVRGDVFLVALRERGLPCVAVSGVLRGERYELLARQFGALAYLEKPFRIEAALGVIAQALPGAIDADTEPEYGTAAPAAAPRAPAPHPGPLPAPRGEGAGTPSTPAATATPTSTAPHPSPPPAPRGEGAGTPSTPAATATPTSTAPHPGPLPAPRGEGAGTPSAPAATATPIAPALAGPEPAEDAPRDLDSLIYSPARPALDETLPGIPLVPPPAHGLELPLPSVTPVPLALRPDAPALPEGSLAHTSIPRLLVALHAMQTTGALTVTRGPVKKLVLVDGGRPVLATSNVASERFGARCVAEGLLTRDEHAALVAQLGPREALGDALVARGRLDEARRAGMVTEQVREIIWSTFPWRDGLYRLTVGAMPRRRRVPVDLALGNLVIEGHRRVSDLEGLRAALPGRLALAPRADGPFPLHELDVSRAEASLLALADGTKTVRDLLLLSQMPERDALAFLQACRDLGLLDEVRRVLAGTRRIGFM